MRYLLPYLLIVILNPYDGINYNEIKTYSYLPKYRKIEMTAYEHDDNIDYNDYHDEEVKVDTYEHPAFLPWFFMERRNDYQN